MGDMADRLQEKALEEITESQGYEEWCDYSERAEEAFARLRRLDERHQKSTNPWPKPGPWCGCGRAWPCPDRRLLDGEER